MNTDRQKQFDAAQKLLVRALDSTSPHEQKIAIRKLMRVMQSGRWAPHEIILTWSQGSLEYAEIARLHGVIATLERNVRAKEKRILELAADLQRNRCKPSVQRTAETPMMTRSQWNSRVNELQIALHQMEKQFGFGDSMRLAINHWYRGLPISERAIGREASRNWLRQHAGWESGRMILDDHKLRWRKNG